MNNQRTERSTSEIQQNLRRMQKSNSLYQNDLEDLYSDLKLSMTDEINNASPPKPITTTTTTTTTNSKQSPIGVQKQILLMNEKADSTQKNTDLTQRIKDLTQKNNDLTQKNKELIQKNIDLTQKSNDLMQQNDAQLKQLQGAASNQNEKSQIEDIQMKLQLQINVNDHQRKQLQQQINEQPVQIVRDIILQLTSTFRAMQESNEEKLDCLPALIKKLDFVSNLPHELVGNVDKYQNDLKTDICDMLSAERAQMKAEQLMMEQEIKSLCQQLDKKDEDIQGIQSEMYQLRDQSVKLNYKLKNYQKKDQENMVIVQQNKTMHHIVTQLQCYKQFYDKFQQVEEEPSTIAGNKQTNLAKSSKK